MANRPNKTLSYHRPSATERLPTSGLAIASLVLSLVPGALVIASLLDHRIDLRTLACLLPLGGFVTVFLAVAATRQENRNHALAIWAFVLGMLWIGLACAAAVAMLARP